MIAAVIITTKHSVLDTIASVLVMLVAFVLMSPVWSTRTGRNATDALFSRIWR